MAEVRVAIVEDEPPARARLRRMLAGHAGFRIVAEADDVAGGLAILRAQAPDLLFLDIRLGAEDGFDLIARAAPPYPLVVFTTAYHEHAVRAFDVAALDYLLKPFDRARFAQCLDRVMARLAQRRGDGQGEADAGEEALRRLAGGLARTPRLRHFVVHAQGRSLIVPVGDVLRLEAAGNYVEVHVAGARHLVRATLSRLAQRLDPAVFLRVHRSHLVRADCVVATAPCGHGDMKLSLRDGSEVMLSRRYRALLPAGAFDG